MMCHLIGCKRKATKNAYAKMIESVFVLAEQLQHDAGALVGLREFILCRIAAAGSGQCPDRRGRCR